MAEDRFEEEDKEPESINDFTGATKRRNSRAFKVLGIFGVVVFFIILMILVSHWIYKIRSETWLATETSQWKKKPVVKKPPLQTMKLKPIQFNLRDPDGQKPVFFQFEIVLAYPVGNLFLQNELRARNLEIRDQIIALISQKTYENINTTEKIGFLKKEILSYINAVLINGKVEDIYLVDFNVIPRS